MKELKKFINILPYNFFLYLCSDFGEMPEWSIGAVSKTVVPFTGTQGSNPCLSAIIPAVHCNNGIPAVASMYTFKY